MARLLANLGDLVSFSPYEENKTEFVKRINDTLIACGDSRYNTLKEKPIYYEVANNGCEYLHFKARIIDVSGCNIAEIGSKIFDLLLKKR